MSAWERLVAAAARSLDHSDCKKERPGSNEVPASLFPPPVALEAAFSEVRLRVVKGKTTMPQTPQSRVGVKLPNLKHWRVRRGLSQTELAQMAGVAQPYIARVETGQQGCNPSVAHKLAEVLHVDLHVLTMGSEGATAVSRIASRYLHRAYLKYILTKEAGTSYSALSEVQLKRHCEGLSWEGVLEVISFNKRELAFLQGELEERRDLPSQVRLFFEEVLREAPDKHIRVLGAARGREPSRKGKEELVRALRELL